MDARQANLESLKNSEVWKEIKTAIDNGEFEIRVDTVPTSIERALEKLGYTVGHSSKGMFVSW